MLYLIGMGLNNESDLSLKAIDAMKKCSLVYCELYTGKWFGDIKKLESMIEKKIEILPREEVESDFLVKEAQENDIALLIPGDPLTATTHMELITEAKNKGIETEIIHSSSIFTAVAESGLQLYKFGRTTTLVYPEHGYEPSSPYDVIKENKKDGLHTLVLLDIKENRNMTIKEAAELLLKNNAISKDEKIVACSQLGGKDQLIKYAPASDLLKDFPVPSTILIPGKLNFKEEEALKKWESKMS